MSINYARLDHRRQNVLAQQARRIPVALTRIDFPNVLARR
jgi:hypothetical protein